MLNVVRGTVLNDVRVTVRTCILNAVYGTVFNVSCRTMKQRWIFLVGQKNVTHCLRDSGILSNIAYGTLEQY